MPVVSPLPDVHCVLQAVGRARLIQIKQAMGTRRTLAPMAGIDWTHVLSIAATLALAVGGVYVLLFAMY